MGGAFLGLLLLIPRLIPTGANQYLEKIFMFNYERRLICNSNYTKPANIAKQDMKYLYGYLEISRSIQRFKNIFY